MTRTPEPRTAVVWPRSFRSQISAVEICAKVKNSSAEAKGLFSQSSMGFVQCEAPGHDSVQLVNITPITMVYGTYNYTGANLNQLSYLGGLTLLVPQEWFDSH